MKLSLRSLRPILAITPCVAAVALMACSSTPDEEGGTGGITAYGGSGGAKGGNPSTGGGGARSGAPGVGGASGSGAGGITSFGGFGGFGTAGNPTAGMGGHMGGADAGMGGRGGNPGGAGRGGSGGGGGGGTAGNGAGGSGTGDDPCTVTTLPSGGTEHASNNASGMAAGLSWTIWSNTNAGSITTFDNPAFSAKWNNAGDFLARVGLQWNASKTYDQYGTITAQFSSKKSGSAGGYSYIGMYGWSVDPCVEWYVVDDSWNNMPVNPGSTTNKGTADIDGGKYTLYTRNTTGTGGSKCPGTSSWLQFYSVRQTARACGQISLTKHFDAWKAAGMTLGKMDQAQILVEVGGGQGSVDFPVANVTAQ